MARTAEATAEILVEFYEEYFGGEYSSRYRIGWQQLRGITGLLKLEPKFLSELDAALRIEGYLFFICDYYFLITFETEFDHEREVSQRLTEAHLYVEEIEDTYTNMEDFDEDDDL